MHEVHASAEGQLTDILKSLTYTHAPYPKIILNRDNTSFEFFDYAFQFLAKKIIEKDAGKKFSSDNGSLDPNSLFKSAYF